MDIREFVSLLNKESITDSRKKELTPIVNYIITSIEEKGSSQLNFICTHNSRRSQFSQFWADVLADFYTLPISNYSGGVEVTACNERTIESIESFGFKVLKPTSENPKYEIEISNEKSSKLWSKLFDDSNNPTRNFAAIMTCSHADENCPFVTGCDARLSLRYDDPKAYDDTIMESTFYNFRSFQIATEINYILQLVHNGIK